MAGRGAFGIVLIALAAGMLSGCDEGTRPFGFLGGDAADAVGDGDAAAPRPGTSTRLVERDVEAPQVFSVSEAGLWDGRPSLGGVWVAHPNAQDPERVIIRNPANGRFVIGALFRRERDNPGPRLQVSSDAAAALGLLAGQPATLGVTALRREEVPVEAPEPTAPPLDTSEVAPGETDPAPAAPVAASPATVPATPEGRIAAAAGAAIDRAAGQPAPGATPAARPAAPAARPAAPAATPARSTGRNLLQIGIFSVEANANRAAAQVRQAGGTVTVKKESSQGKDFWRVVVGPVTDPADRAATLERVKALGYADAYFVTR